MSRELPHIGDLAEIQKERDEAVELLRALVDWGYGQGAPDLAKDDWREAREWLGDADARSAER